MLAKNQKNLILYREKVFIFFGVLFLEYKSVYIFLKTEQDKNTFKRDPFLQVSKDFSNFFKGYNHLLPCFLKKSS